MHKKIITQDIASYNRLNDTIERYKDTIQNVLNVYEKLQIAPVRNMAEFERLVSEPEQFVRETIVNAMENKTIGGIRLSEEKLKQLIELPEYFPKLIDIVTNYQIIKTRVLEKPKNEWFRIENGQLHENAEQIEKDRESFFCYATTPEQIQRLEAFEKLKDAILEASKIFGVELISGMTRNKIIRPTSDFTNLTPNPEAIL